MAFKRFTNICVGFFLMGVLATGVSGHRKNKGDSKFNHHMMTPTGPTGNCPPGTRLVVDTDTARLLSGTSVPRCEVISLFFPLA